MPTKNKTQPTTNSVDDYLQAIDDETRRSDAVKLSKILSETTRDKPIMWGMGIIGYGQYHYKYETGREGDTAAVGFSARKAALTIYGLFHYGENKQNIELAQKLGTHTHGKGCLYIKSLDDINLDVLKKMIINAYLARNN